MAILRLLRPLPSEICASNFGCEFHLTGRFNPRPREGATASTCADAG